MSAKLLHSGGVTCLRAPQSEACGVARRRIHTVTPHGALCPQPTFCETTGLAPCYQSQGIRMALAVLGLSKGNGRGPLSRPWESAGPWLQVVNPVTSCVPCRLTSWTSSSERTLHSCVWGPWPHAPLSNPTPSHPCLAWLRTPQQLALLLEPSSDWPGYRIHLQTQANSCVNRSPHLFWEVCDYFYQGAVKRC